MSDDDQHYNPMLNRLRRNTLTGTAYKHAPKQEKRIAKKVGGHTTPGSGSKRVKGDVRVKSIARIECKATQRKSFSVTREMLEKIEMAAGATDEIPILQVEFLDAKGKIDGTFAVVPVHIIERLVEDARSD
jgi:hypothetical protein